MKSVHLGGNPQAGVFYLVTGSRACGFNLKLLKLYLPTGLSETER